MTTNTYFPVICGGYLPVGLGAGAPVSSVRGCTAVGGGSVGLWLVTINPPNDTLLDEQMILEVSPAWGTNLPEGVSFGVNAISAGTFGIQIYRNDTGAVVDFPACFTVRRIPRDN